MANPQKISQDHVRGIMEAYLAGSLSVADDTENLRRMSLEGIVRQRDHASESAGQLRWDESPFRTMTNRVDNANSRRDIRSLYYFSLVSMLVATGLSNYLEDQGRCCGDYGA